MQCPFNADFSLFQLLIIWPYIFAMKSIKFCFLKHFLEKGSLSINVSRRWFYGRLQTQNWEKKSGWGEGGRTRLPKFGKTSHRFTRDFKTTEKNNQNLIESDAHGNTYAVNDRTSGVLLSALARLNWAIPTPPPRRNLYLWMGLTSHF